MTELYHFPVKIYTAIAQSSAPFSVKAVWHTARSFDVNLGKGKGYVTLNIIRLAEALDRSIATIKNILRLAVKLGFFYAIRWDGENVHISYVGIEKLCYQLGITHLGSIFEEWSDQLSQKLRVSVTRHTLAAKQRHSRYLADKEIKEQDLTLTRSPEQIFDDAGSVIRLGSKSIVEKCGHSLYVNSCFRAYGASQRTVANIIKRTPQTLRKHLKSIKGLEPVRSLQIFQHSNENNPELDKFLQLETALGSCYYRKKNGRNFKALTNLYDLDGYYLFSQSWLRKRILKYSRKKKEPNFFASLGVASP
jgi:DNA-binding CsgD family transcriptional regulator